MAQEELVKMSGKGQLVVPRRIRESEGFKSSDRFVAIEVKDGVIFKKVKIPDIEFEFETLSKDIQSHLEKHGITEEDLAEAIKWARKRQG